MAGIPYVGKAQSDVRDVTTRAYVQGLLAGNLTQGAVDTQLTAGFSSYVTKAYVDTRDLLNATKSFIDTGDATRLHLNQRNVINGVAGLDAQGRIDISRVSLASTQRWPKPFISPSAYNAANVNATTTEVQVYTCAVADPGFVYKLFVSGLASTTTTVDGEYSVLRVRAGNATTGQVVAGGYGSTENYPGGVTTFFGTAGDYTYAVPSWADKLDVITLGGGGGGGGGYVLLFVSFKGVGGHNGNYKGVTLTKGTTLPNGTTSLNVTVGVGGNPGHSGGFSSVSGTGVTTLTATGGTTGDSQETQSGTGQAAGTFNFNGMSYVGGGPQPTFVGTGNAPGGGGGGGSPAGDGHPGGPGADGGVWVFAYPNPNTPIATAGLMPVPFNAQTPITGATTLYITVARAGGSSTQTVQPFMPKLFVLPVPA